MPVLLPRLADGEPDLAVVYEHPVLPEIAPMALGRTYLFDDAFHAVLPRGHRLARSGAGAGPALSGRGGLDGAVVVRGQRDPGVEPGRPAGVPDDAEPGAAGPAADPGLPGQIRQVQPGAAAGQPVPAGQDDLEGVVEQVSAAQRRAGGLGEHRVFIDHREVEFAVGQPRQQPLHVIIHDR